MLARPHAAVVEVPQLGALAARVPLPEVVAVGEDPLLRPRALLVDAAAVDRLLHRGDEDVRHGAVAELDHLGEVVAGVDVHDPERHIAGLEGLAREVQQHDRVLAAAEQQHRPLELRGDLADDVDGLRLEDVEMVHDGTCTGARRRMT